MGSRSFLADRKQQVLQACGLIFFAVSLQVGIEGCRRPAQPRPTKVKSGEASPSPDKIRHESHQVFATWYSVPPDSLAARRAAPGELTAAHNHLPLGTQLQVTNPANGKTVVVRITDRGITGRKMKLDLCKEAAERLGIVSEGMAKLRMEVIDDNPAAGARSAGTPPSD